MGKGLIDVDSVLAVAIFVLSVAAYMAFLKSFYRLPRISESRLIEIERAVVEGGVFFNGSDIGMGEYAHYLVFSTAVSGPQNISLPTLYRYSNSSAFLYTFPGLEEVNFTVASISNESVIHFDGPAGRYIFFYGNFTDTSPQRPVTPLANSTASLEFRGIARIMVFRNISLDWRRFGKPFRISIGNSSIGPSPPTRGEIRAISFPHLCLENGIKECEVRIEEW